MPSLSFSTFVALAAFTAVSVRGQAITGTYPATPLASKTGYTYPSGVPYKVDTDTGLIRGQQAGYNICNSTTENQNSMCQTAFINSIDDFCLWAPPEPNSIVGDIEGEMVAWCTKPGRGTRLIPDGYLTGVQFMKTPNYVQVVGFINQVSINIAAGDWGGEMDPHGADLRGNPMGGLLFSQAFDGEWRQVAEWHNFMGGNAFCLKACDPSLPDDENYCEHRFDRIGCQYNAPNNAQNGTFESCLGDNQDFPGVYTLNGQTLTYTQPPEELGAIMTMPYTARVPPSSSCTQYTSSAIYTGLPRIAAAATANATTTGSSRPTGAPTATGDAANATGQGNGASSLGVSGNAVLLGVAISVLLQL